jgi:hypothetical protein
MTRTKKLKKYTFHVPVNEIWEMEVEAVSEAEAWEKAKNHEWYQVCSFAGTTASGDTELAYYEEIDDE